MKLIPDITRFARSFLVAVENPLLGTWQLKSYVATTGSGEKSMPYGEHPCGYLSYSADGRMHAIGTADGRLAPPQSTTLADGDLATLHRTMFAYAGTYSVAADRVIHRVDVSWNQTWNGTDQIRFFALIGDTLTLTSQAINPLNAVESTYVVVFQKLKQCRRRSSASRFV